MNSDDFEESVENLKKLQQLFTKTISEVQNIDQSDLEEIKSSIDKISYIVNKNSRQ